VIGNHPASLECEFGFLALQAFLIGLNKEFLKLSLTTSVNRHDRRHGYRRPLGFSMPLVRAQCAHNSESEYAIVKKMQTMARILKDVVLRLLSPFRKPREPENDASIAVDEFAARFKVYEISDWTPRKKSRP
jgi:hypothetical protein